MKALQANELRIGNLVLDSSKNTTIIESIIPEHARIRFGIPLTEEWLKRMGFEQSEREDSALVHKESSLPIWSNDEGGFYYIDNEIIIYLDYVHQIQNFFFIATGTELTI